MRRAAVAVMVGCAFGGIATGVGHQRDISGVRLTAAIQSIASKAAAKAAAPAMKTVEYRGYAIRVPATWPVYSLSKDPSQCVRYDVNAVYLGTPGPNPDCPAHVVGRADTVSIGGPDTPGQRSTPLRTDLRAAVGAKRAGTDMPAAPGTIMQNAQLRELSVAMPGRAPAITATYGTSPDEIMQVLAGLRQITQQSAPTGTAAANSAQPRPNVVAASALPQAPPSNPARPSNPAPPANPAPPTWLPPTWIPPSWPAPAPTGTGSPTQPAPGPSSSPPPASPAGPLAGFDTCGAPSLQTMKAWRAKYAVAAIYIGGQEMGCGYGNLSKSWVQSAEAMGWSLMPTFVGLQAPCNSFSDEINPSQAAQQGQQAATQAVSDAASFGLGPGSPIYFDMEAYNETEASCVTAVLTFLDAWDRQVQASGYVSGVYSSAGSGVINLQNTTSVAGHPLAKPQAIWFALWDNAVNLTGSPYMTPAVWSPSARSKQYAGPRVVTVGGVSLNIDSDLVNGPVARG
jgi:glycoside hydrolase-like protein